MQFIIIITMNYFRDILIFLELFAAIQGLHNNVCRNYEGYLNIIFSSQCYCSADLSKSVPDISARYTGASQTHKVTTLDGYILSLFRIPQIKSSPKGVILLHHPLFADANVWLNQENESIALFFWRQGFDVWLSNDRGTKYSLKHESLSVSQREFWNFSFHEIGFYDNKAVIDYIFEKTGASQKIIYVGHSLATTASLVYASLRPREAEEKLKVVVNLAPIAILKNLRGPVNALIFLEPAIRKILNALRVYAIFPFYSEFTTTLRKLAIKLPFKFILDVMFSWVCGWSLSEFDPRFFNELFSQFPSGTAAKLLYHFTQIARSSGEFKMYDYGEEENLKIYNKPVPPFYPLDKIQTQFYFVYSETDRISTDKDSEILFSMLPNRVQTLGNKKVKGINHVDYHYGKDRMVKIYDNVLQVILEL